MHPIKFEILKTGHIVLQAHVNNIPARMLIDTGAQRTALCDIAVEKFNVADITLKEYDVMGAASAMICREALINVSIGEFPRYYQTRLTKAIIMSMSGIHQAFDVYDLQPVDGIIGADILAAREALIDYNSQTITFNK